MNFTVEEIGNKINELVAEVNTEGSTTSVLEQVMDQFANDDNAEGFAKMITAKVMEMTSEIADEMGKAVGAPAMTVAGQAHTVAMAHLAILMLAAGWSLKTDQFAAAENITDEDIEATIASILGGSND
jgi:glutathionyl-hydroquinone reductase